MGSQSKFGIILRRSSPSRSLVLDISRMDDLPAGGDMDYGCGYGFINEKQVFEVNYDHKPSDDGQTVYRELLRLAKVEWEKLE